MPFSCANAWVGVVWLQLHDICSASEHSQRLYDSLRTSVSPPGYRRVVEEGPKRGVAVVRYGK